MKCRARLGAVVDCAHTQVWWTRARRQRQWAQAAAAATLAVDCCGLDGTVGSGHERAQAAAGLRALITGQARRTPEVESRAREQRTGLKWLMAGGSGCGCRAREGSKQGRAWTEYEWKEYEPPPPPPLPFFL